MPAVLGHLQEKDFHSDFDQLGSKLYFILGPVQELSDITLCLVDKEILFSSSHRNIVEMGIMSVICLVLVSSLLEI